MKLAFTYFESITAFNFYIKILALFIIIERTTEVNEAIQNSCVLWHRYINMFLT